MSAGGKELRESLTLALLAMDYADRLGHVKVRQSDYDNLRAIRDREEKSI